MINFNNINEQFLTELGEARFKNVESKYIKRVSGISPIMNIKELKENGKVTYLAHLITFGDMVFYISFTEPFYLNEFQILLKYNII